MALSTHKSAALRQLVRQLREQDGRPSSGGVHERPLEPATPPSEGIPSPTTTVAPGGERPPVGERTIVPSGIPAFNDLLPHGGWQSGMVVEWLVAGEGCGAWMLGWLLSRPWWEHRKAVVVIAGNAEWRFHPPAATAAGCGWKTLIVVRPAAPQDVLWGWEQALRCRGVGLTCGLLPRLDDREGRRLKLAAERGGGAALLIRPWSVHGQPSWADVRFGVEPIPLSGPPVDGFTVNRPEHDVPLGRRWRVEVLRCRGRTRGEAVVLELCHETGRVRVIPPLAAAARARRAAGA